MRPPRRIRRIWMALASAGLLLAPWGAAADARLATASGSVELGRGEPPAWSPARAGADLVPGDLVRTGEDGRAELELGRATLRLYPNSLLRVPMQVESGDPEAVDLERGTSLFDVLRRDGPPFEVRTPEVVVSVKGTRFSVALDDADAAVAVFRGLVGVRSLVAEALHETLVREGFSAAGREAFELSLHSLADPWEAWSRGGLGPVPRPELRRLPAPAGLERAREMAVARGRVGAVTHAAARHPQLQRRLADHSVRQRALDGRREALAARETEIDPVLDDDHLELEDDFIETWLNGGLPTGPGAPPPPFDVAFVSGSGQSGSSYVDLTSQASATTWSFTDNQLDKIESGEESFPANLLSELQDAGINDPEQFADQLRQLFD